MNPQRRTLEDLQADLRVFAEARDWQQFHTPKNLAMAMTVEAGEVLEIFRWLTPEQSAALTPEDRAALADEIADVLIFLARLADVSGIDPIEAAFAKMARNAQRYPVEAARGNALKHHQLRAQAVTRENDDGRTE